MKLCTICKKPIVLVPSAKERAKRYGNTPQYYTNLFTEHTHCKIEKYNKDTVELIKRLSRGAK